MLTNVRMFVQGERKKKIIHAYDTKVKEGQINRNIE